MPSKLMNFNPVIKTMFIIEKRCIQVIVRTNSILNTFLNEKILKERKKRPFNITLRNAKIKGAQHHDTIKTRRPLRNRKTTTALCWLTT